MDWNEIREEERIRREKIEPKRSAYAIKKLSELGIEITDLGSRIEFQYKGHTVRFFPYKGWATGKTINDCRGIENLLKQLKPSRWVSIDDGPPEVDSEVWLSQDGKTVSGEALYSADRYDQDYNYCGEGFATTGKNGRKRLPIGQPKFWKYK